MFTVKVHGADGVINLYRAETIEVIRKGDHYEDGIYLDRQTPELTPEEIAEFERQSNLAGQGRCDPPKPISFAKHIILFGGDATQAAMARRGGRVWIMNETGATVDTYEL